tara:strand:+ start:354 stop:938 length:585 start_codon:yes stop_codon:yes gene_type:complete
VALFNSATRQSVGNNGTGYVKIGLGETLRLRIIKVHDPEEASNANGSWEVVPIDAHVVSKTDDQGNTVTIGEDRRWSPASKNLPRIIDLDDELSTDGKSLSDVVIDVTCKGVKNPHTGNTYHTYVCSVVEEAAAEVDHIAALEAADGDEGLREVFANAWKSTDDEALRAEYKAVYDHRKVQLAQLADDGTDLPF